MRISKAYIEITNRCNLNCTTCYNRSGLNTVTREIGVTELERMITTFTAYGAKRILISGGEPTLHSEFEKIAALPSRYPQLSFGVTTNGTTAAARSVLAPAIKSQKNMTLQISLDGSSEETNALTRGRGNFEKAVEFARSVSDSPAEKRLKMVVSRGNLADVEKFYRLALSLGFTPEFAFIFRSGNGECEWDEKTLTPLEKLKVMKTVQRLNEESGANAQLPLCSLGCPLSLDDSELSLCVKTDGSIQPCQGLYDGKFTVANALSFDETEFAEGMRRVRGIAKARAESPALRWGSYHNVMVQPRQLIFERRVDGERVLVAINAAGETYHADFNAGCGTAVDLITGQPHDFGGGSDLPPYSCAFWRMEH